MKVLVFRLEEFLVGFKILTGRYPVNDVGEVVPKLFSDPLTDLWILISGNELNRLFLIPAAL